MKCLSRNSVALTALVLLATCLVTVGAWEWPWYSESDDEKQLHKEVRFELFSTGLIGVIDNLVPTDQVKFNHAIWKATQKGHNQDAKSKSMINATCHHFSTTTLPVVIRAVLVDVMPHLVNTTHIELLVATVGTAVERGMAEDRARHDAMSKTILEIVGEIRGIQSGWGAIKNLIKKTVQGVDHAHPGVWACFSLFAIMQGMLVQAGLMTWPIACMKFCIFFPQQMLMWSFYSDAPDVGAAVFVLATTYCLWYHVEKWTSDYVVKQSVEIQTKEAVVSLAKTYATRMIQDPAYARSLVATPTGVPGVIPGPVDTTASPSTDTQQPLTDTQPQMIPSAPAVAATNAVRFPFSGLELSSFNPYRRTHQAYDPLSA